MHKELAYNVTLCPSHGSLPASFVRHLAKHTAEVYLGVSPYLVQVESLAAGGGTADGTPQSKPAGLSGLMVR